MIIATIFMFVSLTIISITSFCWLCIARGWQEITWKHVSKKITDESITNDLCNRCARKLEANKCFKIDNHIYCPVCTGIVGTFRANKANKEFAIGALTIIIFFGVIFIASVVSVTGII